MLWTLQLRYFCPQLPLSVGGASRGREGQRIFPRWKDSADGRGRLCQVVGQVKARIRTDSIRTCISTLTYTRMRVRIRSRTDTHRGSEKDTYKRTQRHEEKDTHARTRTCQDTRSHTRQHTHTHEYTRSRPRTQIRQSGLQGCQSVG